MILTDAGPLVALLYVKDRNHASCVKALRSFAEPLVTVWPAIAEAMYLLGFSWEAQRALLGFVETGALRIASLDNTDVPRIRDLMAKYRDLPMDLADAALVRVAERERLQVVFTLDRRDFALYRPSRLGRFQIVP